MMIQEAIKTAIAGENLSRQQAHATMTAIMQGEATPAQIAAFLIAEKLKGETFQEIAGFAQAMREQAARVETRHKNAIDMCGTGGDGLGTFNISTVAALVVAAGGVPVAKHGNRSVSSKSGSADLLEALGVKIDLNAEQAGACLEAVGFAFLFAPVLHPAMKHATGPRKEIGVRTVFNILGPLTNPAGVKRQVLGVYDAQLAHLMAEVLRELASEHVLVIHSEEGMDEVSTQKPTLVVELKQQKITEQKLPPENFGRFEQNNDGILGGSPAENAQIALNILKGGKSAARGLVLVNAACGFVVGEKCKTFLEGTELARQAIDSGAALAKLQALIEFTNDVAL
ncbi:MAG: anthranilate phosphoribosyltransferase [bacterium]